MIFPHPLSPTVTTIQTAAALGSFVFLFLTRKADWRSVLALFFIGQVTAYYWTIEIAAWRGWTMDAYGAIASAIGFGAMLILGGVVKIFQSFHDDPAGTMQWLLRLWEGGGGDQANGGKP